MIQPLLNRADALLLHGDDADALLAIAACRMAVEAALKVHTARVAHKPLESPSAALAAVVLHHHGVLTRGERDALRRLHKVACRAIHTATATPDTAERVVDFSTSIVRRLESRR